MSEHLQVTTEHLLQKKEEWQGILDRAKCAMTAAKEKLDTLNDCFDGQIVREYQEIYGKKQESAEVLLQKLSIHIGSLEEIAMCYEETERSNTKELGTD